MKRRFDRRQFLTTSSAVLALAGMRTGFTQSAKPLQVPAVDTLVVKVLIDSSYDTPKPPASKLVRVRRAGLSGSDYRKTLHNQWGLSLALESRLAADSRHMLLDFGYTPEALMNNMDIMEVDPARMQAFIISHGHFDHMGGLVGLLEKHRGRLPADLTVYVGGEDNFCNRKTPRGAPGHFSDWGVVDRRDLERLKVKIVKCEQPTLIQGHAFTTGVIARRSFERVLPNTIVSYRKANGVGCDMPEADAKAQGEFVPDQHLHEHATCFNVKDRGLVVISSCGHAGIVNTTLQAMEVSGVKKVHAVMGGFHLFPAADDYVRRTVSELRDLGAEVLVPLHCSGPNMVKALQEMLPDRLIPSTTGTEFTFGV